MNTLKAKQCVKRQLYPQVDTLTAATKNILADIYITTMSVKLKKGQIIIIIIIIIQKVIIILNQIFSIDHLV